MKSDNSSSNTVLRDDPSGTSATADDGSPQPQDVVEVAVQSRQGRLESAVEFQPSDALKGIVFGLSCRLATADSTEADLSYRSQLQTLSASQHLCRLTVTNPKAASHPGGIWELGEPNSQLLTSLRLLIRPQQADSVPAVRCVHSRLSDDDEWTSSQRQWRLYQLGSGGENFRSLIHRDRDGKVTVPFRGYRFDRDGETGEGLRATPSLVLEREDGQAIGLHLPRFWQNFPRGLVWEDQSIAIELFPEAFGEPQELQPGEQTTVEFFVVTGDAETVKRRLEELARQPPLCLKPSERQQSGLIPWMPPGDQEMSSEYRAYLELVDQAIEGRDTFFHKRERIDEYGWRNFGEVFGDHEAARCNPDSPLISHYNNQYDVVLGLGIHYLRSGDRRWLELMHDLARHVIDIDLYHTDEDLACYNHGMFWHSTHYVDAGLATHRSYPRGTCGGGPSSGHAYSRGLLLYYYMTGDETAREAVVKMGEWMIAAEDGSKTKYRWLARGESGLTTASGTETYHGPGRGPGNAVEVLVTAFELTRQRRFLDQAEHIIRRVVHPDQDIDALDLLDAENKWFYLMFLQALGRYLEIKISLNEIDMTYGYGKTVLLRFADWMEENERPFLSHPEQLEFPTETWAAQDMRKVEVFQWAARHASGQQRERFLERAEWFFGHSVEELTTFETKSFCRPVALLLSNGYSHEFFRRGGLDRIPEAPPAPAISYPAEQHFVSQKSRAIRNAKLIIGAGGAVVALAMLAGLAAAMR